MVREGSRRVLGMEHFLCTALGGIILHNGDIAEMKTGEGENGLGNVAGVSERYFQQWRACGHRKTNIWQSATASGWENYISF